MAGRILLDTSAVVGFFYGDQTATRLMRTAEEAYLSIVTLGELYFGAERSSRREANYAQVEELLEGLSILPSDAATAHEYGIIKFALRKKGRPLPDNDIWIAAAARQHDLTLATRDDHFREIDDIALIAW